MKIIAIFGLVFAFVWNPAERALADDTASKWRYFAPSGRTVNDWNAGKLDGKKWCASPGWKRETLDPAIKGGIVVRGNHWKLLNLTARLVCNIMVLDWQSYQKDLSASSKRKFQAELKRWRFKELKVKPK